MAKRRTILEMDGLVVDEYEGFERSDGGDRRRYQIGPPMKFMDLSYEQMQALVSIELGKAAE